MTVTVQITKSFRKIGLCIYGPYLLSSRNGILEYCETPFRGDKKILRL